MLRLITVLITTIALTVGLPAAPAIAKGGKSGGSKIKGGDDEEEVEGEEAEEEEGDCGGGAFLAIPALGAVALIRRRKR